MDGARERLRDWHGVGQVPIWPAGLQYSTVQYSVSESSRDAADDAPRGVVARKDLK